MNNPITLLMTKKNTQLHTHYQNLAKNESKVIFERRFGMYRYLEAVA